MNEAAAIRDILGAWPTRSTTLSGGCVGDVRLIEMADRERFVAKLDAAETGQLETEGSMLRFLEEKVPDLPFPRCVHADPSLLLMRWLPGSTGCGTVAEVDLARLVASLHGHTSTAMDGQGFGFPEPTVVGPVPQPNRWTRSWTEFFGEQRLAHCADLCVGAGRLDRRTARRIAQIASRLDRLLDEPERPSLLHGDLWSGNILSSGGRITGLIDPALYYGHPEVELAFLAMFRTVGDRFFQAYRSFRGIGTAEFEEFHSERRHLYTLYPLLVHVYIFGAQYVDDVHAVVDRFA